MSVFNLYPTIKPTLSFDFVNAGVLDPSVTFTRTTSATYFDETGILRVANANTPRLDYDPATLLARGLLIEEARTNLLTWSEDFGNAAWTSAAATLSSNAATAPDGALTADSYTATAVSGEHRILRASNTTVAASSTITFSVFVKASGITRLRLNIYDSPSRTKEIVANVNLSTGTINTPTAGGGYTAVASSIQAYSNNFYRISITGTVDAATTSVLCDLGLQNSAGNSNWTPAGTEALIVWGAQLEAGAFPTSYVPTTTTALTRSADVASVNTLTPWYNASGGTIFVEGSTQFLPGDSAQFFGFTDGTANNFVSISANNVTSVNRIQGNALVSGVNQFTGVNANNGTYTAGTTFKAALAFVTNDAQLAFNGATVGSNDVSCTVPTVTSMSLGSGYIAGNRSINGYLRRITYYPVRLSNAQLQNITA